MAESNIKVVVRVRPFTKREEKNSWRRSVDVRENTVSIVNAKATYGECLQDAFNNACSHKFTFDHVFHPFTGEQQVLPSSPLAFPFDRKISMGLWPPLRRRPPPFQVNADEEQQRVYEEIGISAEISVLDGYNACILAYGPSGSGKTYTVLGCKDSPGLAPRICKGLLDRLANKWHHNIEFSLSLSLVEIYKERVCDLLTESKTKKNLRVREHPSSGAYVDGVTWHEIGSVEVACDLLERGRKCRKVGATSVHCQSSRSHALLTLCVVQPLQRIKSKLTLVDLAGSEKAGESVDRNKLQEGGSINQSLVALGNVISCLADKFGDNQTSTSPKVQSVPLAHYGGSWGCPGPPKKQPSNKSNGALHGSFIPYRDSVLTWLLKDTLGGNSNTIMIATIGPCMLSEKESLYTLRYAARARNIINKPVVNLETEGNDRCVGDARKLIHLSHKKSLSRLCKITRSQKKENSRKSLETCLLKPRILRLPQAEGFEQSCQLKDLPALPGQRSSVPFLVNTFDDAQCEQVVVFHLQVGTSLIGSSRNCDLRLLGDKIHGMHCSLTHDERTSRITLRVLSGSITVNGRRLIKADTKHLQNDDIVRVGDREFVLRQRSRTVHRKRRPQLRHTMLSRARILSSSLAKRPAYLERTKCGGLQWWSKKLRRRPSLVKICRNPGLWMSSNDETRRKSKSLKEIKNLERRATPLGISADSTKNYSRSSTPNIQTSLKEKRKKLAEEGRQVAVSDDIKCRIFPGVGRSADSEELNEPLQSSSSKGQKARTVFLSVMSKLFSPRKTASETQRSACESDSDYDFSQAPHPNEERLSPVGASYSEGNTSVIGCDFQTPSEADNFHLSNTSLDSFVSQLSGQSLDSKFAGGIRATKSLSSNSLLTDYLEMSKSRTFESTTSLQCPQSPPDCRKRWDKSVWPEIEKGLLRNHSVPNLLKQNDDAKSRRLSLGSLPSTPKTTKKKMIEDVTNRLYPGTPKRNSTFSFDLNCVKDSTGVNAENTKSPQMPLSAGQQSVRVQSPNEFIKKQIDNMLSRRKTSWEDGTPLLKDDCNVGTSEHLTSVLHSDCSDSIEVFSDDSLELTDVGLEIDYQFGKIDFNESADTDHEFVTPMSLSRDSLDGSWGCTQDCANNNAQSNENSGEQNTPDPRSLAEDSSSSGEESSVWKSSKTCLKDRPNSASKAYRLQIRKKIENRIANDFSSDESDIDDKAPRRMKLRRNSCPPSLTESRVELAKDGERRYSESLAKAEAPDTQPILSKPPSLAPDNADDILLKSSLQLVENLGLNPISTDTYDLVDGIKTLLLESSKKLVEYGLGHSSVNVSSKDSASPPIATLDINKQSRPPDTDSCSESGRASPSGESEEGWEEVIVEELPFQSVANRRSLYTIVECSEQSRSEAVSESDVIPTDWKESNSEQECQEDSKSKAGQSKPFVVSFDDPFSFNVESTLQKKLPLPNSLSDESDAASLEEQKISPQLNPHIDINLLLSVNGESDSDGVIECLAVEDGLRTEISEKKGLALTEPEKEDTLELQYLNAFSRIDSVCNLPKKVPVILRHRRQETHAAEYVSHCETEILQQPQQPITLAQTPPTNVHFRNKEELHFEEIDEVTVHLCLSRGFASDNHIDFYERIQNNAKGGERRVAYKESDLKRGCQLPKIKMPSLCKRKHSETSSESDTEDSHSSSEEEIRCEKLQGQISYKRLKFDHQKTLSDDEVLLKKLNAWTLQDSVPVKDVCCVKRNAAMLSANDAANAGSLSNSSRNFFSLTAIGKPSPPDVDKTSGNVDEKVGHRFPFLVISPHGVPRDKQQNKKNQCTTPNDQQVDQSFFNSVVPCRYLVQQISTSSSQTSTRSSLYSAINTAPIAPSVVSSTKSLLTSTIGSQFLTNLQPTIQSVVLSGTSCHSPTPSKSMIGVSGSSFYPSHDVSKACKKFLKAANLSRETTTVLPQLFSFAISNNSAFSAAERSNLAEVLTSSAQPAIPSLKEPDINAPSTSAHLYYPWCEFSDVGDHLQAAPAQSKAPLSLVTACLPELSAAVSHNQSLLCSASLSQLSVTSLTFSTNTVKPACEYSRQSVAMPHYSSYALRTTNSSCGNLQSSHVSIDTTRLPIGFSRPPSELCASNLNCLVLPRQLLDGNGNFSDSSSTEYDAKSLFAFHSSMSNIESLESSCQTLHSSVVINSSSIVSSESSGSCENALSVSPSFSGVPNEPPVFISETTADHSPSSTTSAFECSIAAKITGDNVAAEKERKVAAKCKAVVPLLKVRHCEEVPITGRKSEMRMPQDNLRMSLTSDAGSCFPRSISQLQSPSGTPITNEFLLKDKNNSVTERIWKFESMSSACEDENASAFETGKRLYPKNYLAAVEKGRRWCDCSAATQCVPTNRIAHLRKCYSASKDYSQQYDIAVVDENAEETSAISLKPTADLPPPHHLYFNQQKKHFISNKLEDIQRSKCQEWATQKPKTVFPVKQRAQLAKEISAEEILPDTSDHCEFVESLCSTASSLPVRFSAEEPPISHTLLKSTSNATPSARFPTQWQNRRAPNIKKCVPLLESTTSFMETKLSGCHSMSETLLHHEDKSVNSKSLLDYKKVGYSELTNCNIASPVSPAWPLMQNKRSNSFGSSSNRFDRATVYPCSKSLNNLTDLTRDSKHYITHCSVHPPLQNQCFSPYQTNTVVDATRSVGLLLETARCGESSFQNRSTSLTNLANRQSDSKCSDENFLFDNSVRITRSFSLPSVTEHGSRITKNRRSSKLDMTLTQNEILSYISSFDIASSLAKNDVGGSGVKSLKHCGEGREAHLLEAVVQRQKDSPSLSSQCRFMTSFEIRDARRDESSSLYQQTNKQVHKSRSFSSSSRHRSFDLDCKLIRCFVLGESGIDDISVRKVCISDRNLYDVAESPKEDIPQNSKHSASSLTRKPTGSLKHKSLRRWNSMPLLDMQSIYPRSFALIHHQDEPVTELVHNSNIVEMPHQFHNYHTVLLSHPPVSCVPHSDLFSKTLITGSTDEVSSPSLDNKLPSCKSTHLHTTPIVSHEPKTFTLELEHTHKPAVSSDNSVHHNFNDEKAIPNKENASETRCFLSEAHQSTCEKSRSVATQKSHSDACKWHFSSQKHADSPTCTNHHQVKSINNWDLSCRRLSLPADAYARENVAANRQTASVPSCLPEYATNERCTLCAPSMKPCASRRRANFGKIGKNKASGRCMPLESGFKNAIKPLSQSLVDLCCLESFHHCQCGRFSAVNDSCDQSNEEAHCQREEQSGGCCAFAAMHNRESVKLFCTKINSQLVRSKSVDCTFKRTLHEKEPALSCLLNHHTKSCETYEFDNVRHYVALVRGKSFHNMYVSTNALKHDHMLNTESVGLCCRQKKDVSMLLQAVNVRSATDIKEDLQSDGTSQKSKTKLTQSNERGFTNADNTFRPAESLNDKKIQQAHARNIGQRSDCANNQLIGSSPLGESCMTYCSESLAFKTKRLQAPKDFCLFASFGNCSNNAEQLKHHKTSSRCHHMAILQAESVHVDVGSRNFCEVSHLEIESSEKEMDSSENAELDTKQSCNSEEVRGECECEWKIGGERKFDSLSTQVANSTTSDEMSTKCHDLTLERKLRCASEILKKTFEDSLSTSDGASASPNSIPNQHNIIFPATFDEQYPSNDDTNDNYPCNSAAMSNAVSIVRQRSYSECQGTKGTTKNLSESYVKSNVDATVAKMETSHEEVFDGKCETLKSDVVQVKEPPIREGHNLAIDMAPVLCGTRVANSKTTELCSLETGLKWNDEPHHTAGQCKLISNTDFKTPSTDGECLPEKLHITEDSMGFVATDGYSSQNIYDESEQLEDDVSPIELSSRKTNSRKVFKEQSIKQDSFIDDCEAVDFERTNCKKMKANISKSVSPLRTCHQSNEERQQTSPMFTEIANTKKSLEEDSNRAYCFNDDSTTISCSLAHPTELKETTQYPSSCPYKFKPNNVEEIIDSSVITVDKVQLPERPSNGETLVCESSAPANVRVPSTVSGLCSDGTSDTIHPHISMNKKTKETNIFLQHPEDLPTSKESSTSVPLSKEMGNVSEPKFRILDCPREEVEAENNRPSYINVNFDQLKEIELCSAVNSYEPSDINKQKVIMGYHCTRSSNMTPVYEKQSIGDECLPDQFCAIENEARVCVNNNIEGAHVPISERSKILQQIEVGSSPPVRTILSHTRNNFDRMSSNEVKSIEEISVNVERRNEYGSHLTELVSTEKANLTDETNVGTSCISTIMPSHGRKYWNDLRMLMVRATSAQAKDDALKVGRSKSQDVCRHSGDVIGGIRPTGVTIEKAEQLLQELIGNMSNKANTCRKYDQSIDAHREDYISPFPVQSACVRPGVQNERLQLQNQCRIECAKKELDESKIANIGNQRTSFEEGLYEQVGEEPNAPYNDLNKQSKQEKRRFFNNIPESDGRSRWNSAKVTNQVARKRFRPYVNNAFKDTAGKNVSFHVELTSHSKGRETKDFEHLMKTENIGSLAIDELRTYRFQHSHHSNYRCSCSCFSNGTYYRTNNQLPVLHNLSWNSITKPHMKEGPCRVCVCNESHHAYCHTPILRTMPLEAKLCHCYSWCRKKGDFSRTSTEHKVRQRALRKQIWAFKVSGRAATPGYSPY